MVNRRPLGEPVVVPAATYYFGPPLAAAWPVLLWPGDRGRRRDGHVLDAVRHADRGSRLPAAGARSLVIAAGMLFTAVVWAVMQYGIWRAVDATAARDFTPRQAAQLVHLASAPATW
jgi:hypothetical protein